MIINIVSACGGQGRSFLAAQLAGYLADINPGQVLLVDGCSDEGVQWQLGAERSTAYDMGDALCGRCRVGDALYTFGGMRIMPPASDDADVHTAQLTGLLSDLSVGSEFVIYDSPCGSWSRIAAVADISDLTLLCTFADEFSLNAAYRLRRRLPEQDSRCRLVLTGYSVKGVRSGSLWGVDRSIDRVGARLIGIIPDRTAGSPCITAGRNIARRILGEEVPLIKLP